MGFNVPNFTELLSKFLWTAPDQNGIQTGQKIPAVRRKFYNKVWLSLNPFFIERINLSTATQQ